ncbi:hydantoinase/oxoprolinase family protein [Nocardioides sp.]|uniref:hydantoinase/oxoprolinase family protein n=1 Tax=Nocardioides sp. TaxID=35761 RepID=UPI0039E59700
MIRVGVDTGGTFTDVFAYDAANGTSVIAKVPSTPPDFHGGIVNGVGEALRKLGAGPEQIERISYGTTIATNAILEHKGVRIGQLLTAGHEDILFIGRLRRTRMYDLFVDAAEPLFLAERSRTRGVTERLDSSGGVVTPLDEEQLVAGARELVEDEHVEVLVVSFLNAYANPAHEERAFEVLSAAFPGVPVTVATRLSRRAGEYERLVLASFDAYIRPAIVNHLVGLEEALEAFGTTAPVQIMQSSGGLAGVESTRLRPIGTALSGPAAGVVGAARVNEQSGGRDCVTFDMGGTSTDVALVRDGEALLTAEGRIEEYPLSIPMVGIHTIGAGGGSIASLDEGGGLRVGPHSAGATPGPACYGRGGTWATTTDASAVLGYMDGNDSGGTLEIERDLAVRAVEQHVATPLGMSVEEAALGIHRVANAAMAQAVRLVSISQGNDPRDMSLLAFGGAGPIHAGLIADELDIPVVLIPPAAGVLSALGILSADTVHDAVTSLGGLGGVIDALDLRAIGALVSDLDRECLRKIELDGYAADKSTIKAYGSMRYRGQYHQLEVPVDLPLDAESLKRAAEAFHQEHEKVYAYSKFAAKVELVGIRVARAVSDGVDEVPLAPTEGTSGQAGQGEREVVFRVDEQVSRMRTPVIARASLAIGETVAGPAIITQADATVVVYPGHRVEVEPSGTLRYTTGKGKA